MTEAAGGEVVWSWRGRDSGIWVVCLSWKMWTGERERERAQASTHEKKRKKRKKKRKGTGLRLHVAGAFNLLLYFVESALCTRDIFLEVLFGALVFTFLSTVEVSPVPLASDIPRHHTTNCPPPSHIPSGLSQKTVGPHRRPHYPRSKPPRSPLKVPRSPQTRTNSATCLPRQPPPIAPPYVGDSRGTPGVSSRTPI